MTRRETFGKNLKNVADSPNISLNYFYIRGINLIFVSRIEIPANDER